MNLSPSDEPAIHKRNLGSALYDRFSLLDEEADNSIIDYNLRNGVEWKDATLWLLFAIFIAPIWLNVNSTAVLTGAILISPLIGLIMGIGYGVGINDFLLAKKAFINLKVATTIICDVNMPNAAVSPVQSILRYAASRQIAPDRSRQYQYGVSHVLNYI